MWFHKINMQIVSYFFFLVLPALKGMKWVALILTRGRAGLLEGG